MWLLGDKTGIGSTERADFASDHVPGAKLKSFIAVSSSTGPVPMGAGVADFRDVARCSDLDARP